MPDLFSGIFIPGLPEPLTAAIITYLYLDTEAPTQPWVRLASESRTQDTSTRWKGKQDILIRVEDTHIQTNAFIQALIKQ